MNRAITNITMLGIVLLIAGVIVLLLGLAQRQRAGKLGASCTKETDGTIKDVLNQQGNGSNPRFNQEQTSGWLADDNWKLLVAFVADGKAVESLYWRGFRQKPAQFQPGQTVFLRYDPAAPENFVLAEDNPAAHLRTFWLLGALAALAGIVCIVVGMVV